MPAETPPSPILATTVAAGALLVLLFNLKPKTPQPARQRGVAEPGGQTSDTRGRLAAHPGEIPARGWWDILKRTASQVSDDRVLTEAAGITFFTLLALFPAIGALISIYGIFADPGTISEHLQAVSVVVPEGGMQIIGEQIERIVAKGGTSLGVGALLGLATSLWSANQAMKALVDALNVVYGEQERRSFLRRTALTLAFTLAGILFILLAMAGVVVLPIAMQLVGLDGQTELLVGLARWPVLALVIGVLLACIYRFGPSRSLAQWRWVSVGSAVAAAGFLGVSLGFSWYVSSFGNYNETYGSLGAVVGFMTWVWLSATVVLVGAELDAEMEHQTARDTTHGPERPLGARGARMANEVAS